MSSMLSAVATSHPTPPAMTGDGQGLIDALARTSFAVMGVLNRIGSEHDLSLTQIRVLAILEDRRCKMRELADYLGLDKSTISGLVERGEKRGLIQRAPNLDDRRAVEVFLTTEGARLAETGRTEIATALWPMIGQLDQSQARQLTVLLEEVLARSRT